MDGNFVICYEIDPSLNPSFDNVKSIDKRDSNNGVSEEYTRLVLGMAKYEKQQYSQRYVKDSMLPRMMWVNKQKTLLDLHHQVFEYL